MDLKMRHCRFRIMLRPPPGAAAVPLFAETAVVRRIESHRLIIRWSESWGLESELERGR